MGNENPSGEGKTRSAESRGGGVKRPERVDIYAHGWTDGEMLTIKHWLQRGWDVVVLPKGRA